MMAPVNHAERPALDPELAEVLTTMPHLTAPVLPENLLQIRRRAARARPTDEDLSAGGRVQVSELLAGAVPILLLSPVQGPATGLVCYFHGGGLVTGDERTGAELLVDWVIHTGVACASVGYRLAPEHPYPAPVEDCYAAVCWLAEWWTGPSPLVLAGTSAGGGLAAAVTFLARDRGRPAVDAQVLMSPMIDDRMVAPSARSEQRQVWDRRSNRTGWDAYLAGRTGEAGVPAEAAPARRSDLTGLPPAYVDVGSAELFRDEVLDYGSRLAQAGVPVEMHLWSGAFHGFEHFAPQAAVSATTRQVRRDHLNRLVGGRPS
ncbi:MAG TPA: alpha/beta hydrolase [Acidimicrobiales bacterium]|jgi:acetyl esterase/lipase|nr:alpha/beta hydrolase [Acidimicrobiales bacterium]